MAAVVCKGCGNKQKMDKAPPGSLPTDWSMISGAAYCPSCSQDAPGAHMTQRMSESVTSAVIQSCLTEPGLSQAIAALQQSQSPGSPEFVRAVRSLVEATCAAAAESLPPPLRTTFHEVLACVSWVRVAEAVSSPASLRSPPKSREPEPSGSDPFDL